MSQSHLIRTERLILKPWEAAEVGRLVMLSQHPGFAGAFGALEAPMNLARAQEWVGRSLDSLALHGLGSWGVWEGGHPVGLASLLPRSLDGSEEQLVAVEYHLIPSAQGRGLATEALQGLLDYGVRERGLREVYAFVPPDNQPARNVAFKLGMTYLKMAFFCGKRVEVFHLRPTPGTPQTRFNQAESAA